MRARRLSERVLEFWSEVCGFLEREVILRRDLEDDDALVMEGFPCF